MDIHALHPGDVRPLPTRPWKDRVLRGGGKGGDRVERRSDGKNVLEHVGKCNGWLCSCVLLHRGSSYYGASHPTVGSVRSRVDPQTFMV